MIARLKIIRREAGLPAAAIAKAVGVSLQTVFNWESGKAHPRRTHMNTVHDFLMGMGAINQDITTGMLFDLIPPDIHRVEIQIEKKDPGAIGGEDSSASVPC